MTNQKSNVKKRRIRNNNPELEPQDNGLNVTEWSLLRKINDTSNRQRKPIIQCNKALFRLLNWHKIRPGARVGLAYQVRKVEKIDQWTKKHLKKREDFFRILVPDSWSGY
jgi:hypothetical protein